jgi:hypothetical protein
MIVFLGVVAGVRKVRSISRRWSDTHVPLVVKPGGYDQVVSELDDVLAHAGVQASCEPAPSVLIAPAHLLDRVAGRTLGAMVPDRLMSLVGPGLEILIYPTDVAISAEPSVLARARAAIVSRLTRAPAWLTVSAEAQAIEDDIRAAAHRQDRWKRQAALADVDARLASVVVPFDEWETLYRMRLQVDRSPDGEDAGPGTPPSISQTGGTRTEKDKLLRRGVSIAYAIAVASLLALDALLLLGGRGRDRQS